MADALAHALLPIGPVGLLQFASGEVHGLMPAAVGLLTLCGINWEDPSFEQRYAAVPGAPDCPDCLAAHQLAADLTARILPGDTDAIRQVGAAYLLAAHVLDSAPIPQR